MPAILITLFTLQVLTPSPRPSPEAQRRIAETLSEAGAGKEAADAWIALAEMDPAQRSEALDEAHINLLAAYFYYSDVEAMCRAVELTETVMHAGGFAESDRTVWQDRKTYDEQELRTHAETTKSNNCRFNANGRPRVRVAMLPDTPERSPEPPPTPEGPAQVTAPSPVLVVPSVDTWQQRQRTHRIAGAVLASVGVGLAGGMIGAASKLEKHVAAIRSEVAERDGRRFTADEFADFEALGRQATRTRGLAIGLGVSAGVAVTSAIIVWATGKNRRESRTSRVRFIGTSLRF